MALTLLRDQDCCRKSHSLSLADCFLKVSFDFPLFSLYRPSLIYPWGCVLINPAQVENTFNTPNLPNITA